MRDINWDSQLTLIQQRFESDSIGNQAETTQEVPLLARVKSVNRNEFYLAGQAGLRPEMIFEIHAIEYSGEMELIFEGKRYSIIRTYQSGQDILELICQRKASNWHE